MAGTASSGTIAAFGRRWTVDVPDAGVPTTDAVRRRAGAGEEAR